MDQSTAEKFADKLWHNKTISQLSLPSNGLTIEAGRAISTLITDKPIRHIMYAALYLDVSG